MCYTPHSTKTRTERIRPPPQLLAELTKTPKIANSPRPSARAAERHQRPPPTGAQSACNPHVGSAHTDQTARAATQCVTNAPRIPQPPQKRTTAMRTMGSADAPHQYPVQATAHTAGAHTQTIRARKPTPTTTTPTHASSTETTPTRTYARTALHPGALPATTTHRGRQHAEDAFSTCRKQQQGASARKRTTTAPATGAAAARAVSPLPRPQEQAQEYVAEDLPDTYMAHRDAYCHHRASSSNPSQPTGRASFRH